MMTLPLFSSFRSEHSREHTPLLTTKWQIPQLPAVYVPRPHLVEQMRAAMTRRLLLISAPAGFGKTALLAEWCRSTDLAVTWLSLSPTDNEPERFFTYLLAALQRHEPSLGSRSSSFSLPEHRPTTGEDILIHLINDLASHTERERVVVLDHYHLITNDALHQAVCFLLEHLPLQTHLVIGTRADPPFPLARWRAQGRLAELRSEALRFSDTEVKTFLRLADLSLSEDLPYQIAQRTEGWVAGVQLAVLACKQEPSAVLSLTPGARGVPWSFIAAYLDAEILAKLSPETQAFLVQTSLLQRLSGSLCDAVTGRSDSQAILEWLSRMNHFTEALDESGQWYRYHPLFADALQRHLEEQDPEQASVLHRRASLWYEQHGMIEQAIEHALSAHDEAHASVLLEADTRTFLVHGAYTALLRWLERMPEALLFARPHLGILYAWMLVCDERIEQAHAVAHLVECRLRELEGDGASAEKPASKTPGVVVAPSSPWQEERAEFALLSATLALLQQEPARALTLVEQALRIPGEHSPFITSFAAWHLGLIARIQGDFAGAEAALREACIPDPTAGLHAGHLVALTELAHLYEARGDLWNLARLYQDARRLLIRRGQARSPLMGEVLIGMSQLWRERNALSQATTYAQQALSLGREANRDELILTSMLTLATIAQAQRRGEEVERWLHTFDLFLEEQMVPASIRARMGASRARLELAEGSISFTLDWAEMRGLYPGDCIIETLEDAWCGDPLVLTHDVLVLARLHIAQEQHSRSGTHVRQALMLLSRVRTLAERSGLTGRVIETTILQALALQIQGKIGEATARLKQAVELAEPRGYLRLFADEGAPMASLLAKVLGQRQDTSGYLHTLLQACVTSEPKAVALDPTAPRQSLPSVLTPLSQREREILRWLATGASNQEIAERLVITLETVKRHVRHILAKLSVTNRTQAVVRARDLQLL
jgi:LuxR family maltose regulon positive regulatory protein